MGYTKPCDRLLKLNKKKVSNRNFANVCTREDAMDYDVRVRGVNALH